MPKIQAETANGLVETDGPDGKKLLLILEDAGIDILQGGGIHCGGQAIVQGFRQAGGQFLRVADGDGSLDFQSETAVCGGN